MTGKGILLNYTEREIETFRIKNLTKKRHDEQPYPMHIDESHQSDATLTLKLGKFQSSFPASGDEKSL